MEYQVEDHRRLDRDGIPVDVIRARADVDPQAAICGACRASLSGAVSLCTRCGQPLADNTDNPRYLVIRPGSARPYTRREAVRLLAAPDSSEEIERQLRDLPALFRAPLPDAMIHRLAERLRRCGFRVDVLAEFPPGLGLREYIESLMSRKRRLVPFLALAGLSVGLFGAGWFWMPNLLFCLAVGYWIRDQRRFFRRLTLQATHLAGRVDMVPADVLDQFGTLLRDATLSEPLRGALGSLLDEYGHALDTLSPFSARYPDVARPTSQALARLARHAVRVGEKAISIEKAGDFEDPGLEDRLAILRALGSAEIEQRARRLEAAREERAGRLEWLREVYGTLLIRLETVTDTLRSVRQRLLESYVRAEADQGSHVTDELAAALSREQEVVSQTANEMEQLERRMIDLEF